MIDSSRMPIGGKAPKRFPTPIPVPARKELIPPRFPAGPVPGDPLDAWAARAVEWIGQHPRAGVALAAIAGAALGWLVKRR